MCELAKNKSLEFIYDGTNDNEFRSHLTLCFTCQEEIRENDLINLAYKKTLVHVPNLRAIKNAIKREHSNKTLLCTLSVLIVILINLFALNFNCQAPSFETFKSDEYIDSQIAELNDIMFNYSSKTSDSMIDTKISDLHKDILVLENSTF